MITLEQYFTNPTNGAAKPHTPEDEVRAFELLERREALRQEFYLATGRAAEIDPDTGTEISGKKHGSGGGGFRLAHEPGSFDSSHKHAMGVDDSDQDDAFDNWLSTFDRDGGMFNEMLEKHELYREYPAYTPTWAHLTTRAPWSGKRTFIP